MPPRSGFSAELLARVRTGLERARDADRAAVASAYMRNQFEFYGVPAPERRLIARAALDGSNPPTEAQLKAVALACWKEPEREWQYFGCGYLRKHIRVAGPSFMDVAEWLITSKSWWDTVDTLASHTVGPLVRAHPRQLPTLDDWVASGCVWLARTAILHQLGYKTATDADRLFAYCLARADEKEFFIRKAIGWALREYSKTDAVAVKRFVKEHDGELSLLSRTEALKWIERRGEARRSSPS